MAKQAKQVDKDLTDTMVKKSVKNILEHYENIESARGRFMNSARKEREAMTAVYEELAARGVSQKAARTEIRIIRAIERIKGWMAELEAEDHKMVQRLARAQGDKKQLSLLLDVPVPKRDNGKVVEVHSGNGSEASEAVQ